MSMQVSFESFQDFHERFREARKTAAEAAYLWTESVNKSLEPLQRSSANNYDYYLSLGKRAANTSNTLARRVREAIQQVECFTDFETRAFTLAELELDLREFKEKFWNVIFDLLGNRGKMRVPAGEELLAADEILNETHRKLKGLVADHPSTYGVGYETLQFCLQMRQILDSLDVSSQDIIYEEFACLSLLAKSMPGSSLDVAWDFAEDAVVALVDWLKERRPDVHATIAGAEGGAIAAYEPPGLLRKVYVKKMSELILHSLQEGEGIKIDLKGSRMSKAFCDAILAGMEKADQRGSLELSGINQDDPYMKKIALKISKRYPQVNPPM